MGDDRRYLRLEEARQHEEALAKYRDQAHRYDSFMARTLRWREHAVERLDLEPGHTVLDVACGTGANFDLILERIGPEGRLIGIDLSGEMLTVAEARLRRYPDANVELIEAAAEDVRLPTRPERALFSFTHDVLQSERAVNNLLGQINGKGRLAAVGSKSAGKWNLPANLVMRLIASRFVTTFENFDRPWRSLARYAELEIESFALGTIYVAGGRVRPSP